MTASVLQAAFPAAAARASSPGRVVYTERQLFYEVCRGLLPVPGPETPPRSFEPGIEYSAFREALAAFCAEAGWPAGLLRKSTPIPLTLEGREPDVTHYGVARVLVCQGEEIAQMLLANGFHLELACAVLPLPHPGRLLEPLRGMVKRARRASVFALHDASLEGLRWASEGAERCRLPRGAQFRPVGLRPAQALRLQLAANRAAAPDAAGLPTELAPAERAWFAEGWAAELAAVHPARLLRALRRIVLGSIPVPTPELAQSNAGFMTWP